MHYLTILSTIIITSTLALNTGKASANPVVDNFSTYNFCTAGCNLGHWEIPVNSIEEPNIAELMDANLGKYDAGHRGVDLITASGNQIIAPEDGVISYKGVVANAPTVTLMVGEYKNTFQPATTTLPTGSQVGRGEVFAVVDIYRDQRQHCEEVESCLHWGMLIGDNYLNPLDKIYRKNIVLR
jgi:murein DD-endopeptidase MepM/ murein hydrolase activator NlpD